MLQTHSAALPKWGELNESKHYSIPSSSISSICPNPEHSIQINDHKGTSSQSPPVLLLSKLEINRNIKTCQVRPSGAIQSRETTRWFSVVVFSKGKSQIFPLIWSSDQLEEKCLDCQPKKPFTIKSVLLLVLSVKNRYELNFIGQYITTWCYPQLRMSKLYVAQCVIYCRYF